MRVLVARHSGFCFGVRRAVETAERLAAAGGRVFTCGNIIHNDSVVRDLADKGVVPIDDLSALRPGDTLIIRAHGAPPAVYADAQSRGAAVVDATCPFVAHIHRLVERAARDGVPVFIAGEEQHPEVIGIQSRAPGARVLASAEDALHAPCTPRGLLVAQTTQEQAQVDAIAAALATRVAALTVEQTVCDTTRLRQDEAARIASRADRTYVLGSSSSANTRRLLQICNKNGQNAKMIDSIEKISLEIFTSDDIIGIVAGASTPDAMIREVIQGMSEQENPTIETIEAAAPAEVVVEPTVAEEPAAQEAAAPAVAEETAVEEIVEPVVDAAPAVEDVAAPDAAPAVAEETPVAEEPAAVAAEPEEPINPDDFEQAFEQTVKRIRSGQIITGTVLQIVDGEVFVNVGYKADGVIPKGEFSSDPEVKPEDTVKEGDSIDVEVVKVNDGEGNVLLSHKSIEGKKFWDELFSEDVEGKTFDAVVKEVVKAGLIAEIGGVRAFIPASHVSTRYVENLGEYIGKEIKVKVLEVDQKRKRIVASIKQVLLEEAASAKKEKWGKLVVGERVPGVVRRITDFGAFVDIGGLDGLVHVTDAAWGRVKHPSDVFSINQEIEVLILNVDAEKERISLGYKQLQPKPWTMAGEKYPVGSIVEGKVVRIVPFGAFVALEPTIDGLIHISQVALRRIEKVEDELKVGDSVRCKVLEVNPEAKRISLSRKEALLAENPELAEQLAAEKAQREQDYQDRRAQRDQQSDQQQAPQQRRPRSESYDNSERRDTRPDRRRRNNEDGDYELPPVTSTTTSLADLFAGIKVDD